MKYLVLFLFASVFFLHSNGQSRDEKMPATVFKYQQYCRAELERFEFDAHFSIVSANVYFTGANFKNTEKGSIQGPSLKPVEQLMAKCVPGSIVIFDDVKVLGPDKEIRTIPGMTLMLK